MWTCINVYMYICINVHVYHCIHVYMDTRPHILINQVHLFYRGRLQTPAYSAGEESLDVVLLPPAEIPWKELAFRSVALCLERYLVDRERAVFGFHEANLYQ